MLLKAGVNREEAHSPNLATWQGSTRNGLDLFGDRAVLAST